MIVYDGSQKWTALGAGYYRQLTEMKLGLNNDESLCDKLPFIDSIAAPGIQLGYSGNNSPSVYIRQAETLTGATSSAEMKAWFASNPTTVIYPLKEQKSYQLSQNQIYNACIQIGYPYLDCLNMITDRTKEDVEALKSLLADGINPADHKGGYNASDLNRVGTAVNYLALALGVIGIDNWRSCKTDWTVIDIPRIGEIEYYLSSAQTIREKISDYRSDEKLPESMSNLDFAGANQIEKLLSDCDTVVRNIMTSYRGYSGRLESGVNCLP